MNIFILDQDPKVNVTYYIDKHVVKMITEYVQLLSTSCILLGKSAPYRLTHKNHPASLWTRESKSNYKYLWHLADLLGNEYTFRYGKVHQSHIKLKTLDLEIDLPDLGLTNFPNCTPYKNTANIIDAYRQYYNEYKYKFASWKAREKPFWFSGPKI